MIEQHIFLAEMALLEDRHNRKPLLAETAGRYLDYLEGQGLTTPEFQRAAQIVFAEDTFFPSPKRFLEVLSSDNQTRALKAWSQILTNLSSGAEFLTEKGSLSREVLNSLGGPPRLQMLEGGAVAKFEKDFIRLYLDRLEERSRGLFALPGGS